MQITLLFRAGRRFPPDCGADGCIDWLLWQAAVFLRGRFDPPVRGITVCRRGLPDREMTEGRSLSRVEQRTVIKRCKTSIRNGFMSSLLSRPSTSALASSTWRTGRPKAAHPWIIFTNRRIYAILPRNSRTSRGGLLISQLLSLPETVGCRLSLDSLANPSCHPRVPLSGMAISAS